METAGAPQPQNRVDWHYLGVTARGDSNVGSVHVFEGENMFDVGPVYIFMKIVTSA